VHRQAQFIFCFLFKHNGNDRMDFLCNVDLGKKIPSTWKDALKLLHDNFANATVVRAFADVFQQTG